MYIIILLKPSVKLVSKVITRLRSMSIVFETILSSPNNRYILI